MKKIRFVCLLCLLFSLTTTLALAADAEPAAGAELKKDADDVAERERAEREARLARAQARFSEAQLLLGKRNFPEAIKSMEDALKDVPPGAKAEPLRQTIRITLADAYATWASDLGEANVMRPLKDRNWDEAIEKAETALKYNPNDKEIQNLLAELKHAKTHQPTQPILRGPDPDQSPERRQMRRDHGEMLRDARILMETGHLDDAEKILKDILKQDRHNTSALFILRKVQDRLLEVDKARYEVARKRYLHWLEEKWWYERPERPTRTAAPAAALTQVKRNEEILRKLDEIKIREVNFQNADINAVIDFLVDESRRMDPAGTGVNIIVREVPPGRQIRSLRLRDIKLMDVIKVIVDLANMRFVVEEKAVIIVPIDSPYGTQMETRTYPVDPSLIMRLIIQPGGGGAVPPPPVLDPLGGGGGIVPPGGGGGGFGGGGAIAVRPEDLVKYLEGLGVPFPRGSNAQYLATFSRLVVTNTVPNLELLERILTELNVGQFQAEIEIKFLEVSENTLRELGFEWFLGQMALSRVTRDGRPADQLLLNPSQAAFPPTVIPPNRIEHRVTTTPQGTVQVTTTGQGSIEVGGNPFVSGQTVNLTGGLRDLSVVSIGAIESLLGGAASVINDRILSVGGVLTSPQFQVIVKALSRHGTSDLLSAPRITTILGQPATIKIVTEFIYPTRFREPQALVAPGGGGGTGGAGGNAVAVVTPSTPTAFATREIGVLLTVTPVLGADGHTINLSLNPEVSEFLGFINYGGPIQVPAPDTPNGFVTVDNKITQPIFATRSLLTNVAIWDGSTVVLGGLAREDITEINDKVPIFGDIPFLGRFFRSKGKSVGKRNLIIFVTATLIDPSGNRVHPEGTVAQPINLPGMNPGGAQPPR
jgi:general secretion pathway protein D